MVVKSQMDGQIERSVTDESIGCATVTDGEGTWETPKQIDRRAKSNRVGQRWYIEKAATDTSPNVSFGEKQILNEK